MRVKYISWLSSIDLFFNQVEIYYQNSSKCFKNENIKYMYMYIQHTVDFVQITSKYAFKFN